MGFLVVFIAAATKCLLEDGFPLPMVALAKSLVMAIAACLIGTAIYAMINWMQPRIATIRSRSLAAIVFFTTLFVTAEGLIQIGFTGPPGLITLPSTIITTIFLERLITSRIHDTSSD